MTKNLVLLRGVPGSGKTELATRLFTSLWTATGKSGRISHISADNFMVDEHTGGYHFDPKKLKSCHQSCLYFVRGAMESGSDWIFVHNTFTCEWEMEKYFELASQFPEYMVHVVTVENWHGSHSVHGVPRRRIIQMAERFEHRYYGDDIDDEHFSDVIKSLRDVPQTPDYHPEGDVWVHTALVTGSLIDAYPDNHVLHLTGLFHDIGKRDTTRWHPSKKRYTAYGHEEESLWYFERVQNYYPELFLGMEAEEIGLVYYLIENHMRIKQFDQMNESKRNAMMERKEAFELLQVFSVHDNMVRMFETTTPEKREEYIGLFEDFLNWCGLS